MAEGSQGVRAGRAFVEVGVDPTYKRAVSDAERSFEGLGRKIDGIKARFGNRGLMKDITELAVGGGAIAGISFLARTVAQASSAAADMAQRFREGKINAGEAAAEFAKSLPIIGSLATATEDWLDIFTGIRSETKKLAEDVERAAKAMEEAAKKAAALAAARDAVNGLREFNDARPGRVGGPPIPGLGRIGRDAAGRIGDAGGEVQKRIRDATGYGNLDTMIRRFNELQTRARNMGGRPTVPGPFDASTVEGLDEINRRRTEIQEAMSAQQLYDEEARKTAKQLGDLARDIQKVRPIVADLLTESMRTLSGAMDDAANEVGRGNFTTALAAALSPALGAILGARPKAMPDSVIPYAPGVNPDDVQRQAENYGGVRRSSGIGGIPMSPEFLGQVEEQIAEQMQEAMRFSSSSGTFNAAAIQGLQGPGQVQQLNRIATASEETAKELKNRRPLVFTR